MVKALLVDRLPFRCPKCITPLEYTQAVPRAPDHLYCPDCRATRYAPESGEAIGKLS